MGSFHDNSTLKCWEDQKKRILFEFEFKEKELDEICVVICVVLSCVVRSQQSPPVGVRPLRTHLGCLLSLLSLPSLLILSNSDQ